MALNQMETVTLVVGTGSARLRSPPRWRFRNVNGVRHPVTTAYVVHDRQYNFELGAYDHTLPVTIDPILQATYLGGGGIDEAFALAIHPVSHDVYVAGHTASTNFPGTAGRPQLANGGVEHRHVLALAS